MCARSFTNRLAAAVGIALLGAAWPALASDVDGDGVEDTVDVCDNTPAGTAVDPEGRPRGDVDGDCDTDLDDYALFQQGFTGPLDGPVGACCSLDSSCRDLAAAACGGSWLGEGTSCTPNPCATVPANDNCVNATAITGNIVNSAFDTTDATFDGGGACLTSPNVWYAYTASCTGTLTVDTFGSSFDTKLGIYTGPCESLTAVDCNDDAGGGLQSEVVLDAFAGTVYMIEVGGFGSYVGQGALNIVCTPGVVLPNDDCANATQITGDTVNAAFDTTHATFDGNGVCITSPNLWYAYTASCTGTLTVDTRNSSFDTMLGIYAGACDDLTSVDCNDNAPDGGPHAEIVLNATAGTVYIIEVGGAGSLVGQGALNIDCDPTPTPSNDDCASAMEITGNTVNSAFDTTNATFDGDGACLTSPNVWYAYTASCTGTLTVDTFGSSFDTMLGIYTGPCENLTAVDCNDDASGGAQSEVVIDAFAGTVYMIEVGGYGSYAGQGALNIVCTPGVVLPNDDCANATQITGDTVNAAFDTTHATFDGNGLCMTSPNLWYAYTASCSGTLTVDTFGSSFDTKLGVYAGADCAGLTLIECNDDAPSGGLQSEVVLDAFTGTVYMIEVGGFGSLVGQGALNLVCTSGGP